MIKRFLLKLSLLIFCLSLPLANITNAVFIDSAQLNNNQFTTGDWTPPQVTWINPLEGDIKAGQINLEAVCDGTGSESQYVNFWWYKASEGQTITGPDSARENHQYHYVRRSDPSTGTVSGNTFSWELDTTDENLISLNLDWDGEWRFRAACKDAYGNYSHAEINVTIDNTSPVIAGDVVINEVYYDVKDDHSKGFEDKNEWIELYNKTDSPINLKGWYLTDLTHTKPINSNLSIPAHGYLLLAHDNNTWVHYWDDNEAQTVNLTGAKAWLNNNGDQLFLKTPTGQEIDFVAWEGGKNNAYPAWYLDAGQGTSIARKTVGIDTDQPSDWKNLTTPNPGTNPHSHLQTDLDFYLTPDKKSVGFKVTGISPYNQLDYQVSYSPTNREPQGIMGTIELNGEEGIEKENLMLGTESSDVWVYDTGMDKIYLKIILTGDGIPDRELEEKLDY